MATTIDHIVAHLKADPTIAGIVEGRVYPEEVRKAGTDAYPDAWETSGRIRRLIAVDDIGDIVSPFDGHGMVRRQVYVWAFVPRSRAAAGTLDTLTSRVIRLLWMWQDPERGDMAFPAGRAGRQSDSEAMWDRLTFSFGARLNIQE